MAENLNIGDIVYIPQRINNFWEGRAVVTNPSLESYTHLCRVRMIDGRLEGSEGAFEIKDVEVITTSNEALLDNLTEAVEAMRSAGFGVECIVREEIVVKDIKETRL